VFEIIKKLISLELNNQFSHIHLATIPKDYSFLSFLDLWLVGKVIYRTKGATTTAAKQHLSAPQNQKVKRSATPHSTHIQACPP
jgi:hypothetical protein